MAPPAILLQAAPWPAIRGDLLHPAVLADVSLHERLARFLSRFSTSFYNPWAVAVEWLLIGSVVYFTLRFLRGTRGERVFRAILTILTVSFLLVQLVAHQLQLDRISYLYPYFLQAVFLISLVAFQHELRRLLIRLGETIWFGSRRRESERLVDELVEACAKFSSGKIGALIAIERTTQIGAVVDAGVPLDAIVTADLLETIFWPGTPLHDLGVVVRQGRVVAASCQFPLAESGETERSLGSRHRAALGLSQESDTLVLVVSEETGIISIAAHGRFIRGFTPETLKRFLHRILVRGKEPASTATGGAGDVKGSTDDQPSQAA